MISEKSSNFASNLVAPTQAVPAFVVTKKVSKRALARSKRCGVYHRIVFARAENSILELKWWTLIGAVNSGVACLQFPLQQNESAVSRIFGLRQVRLYSPENSTHNFLLFGVKIFWEWHLKKKISLIFSWKQLLKVMWYITEPGSKSLLIHNSTFLVIRKCIFCFLLAKMTQWNSDERERSNICGCIRFQWIFMGCWNYFFLAIILCFWERKRKMRLEKKNFDGIKQFVKILMTPLLLTLAT